MRISKKLYLLILLIEECAEVIHRACKAIRFGMEERQNSPSEEVLENNQERLTGELIDLQTVVQLLQEESLFPYHTKDDNYSKHLFKREKIAKYMAYSRSLGTLELEPE